MLVKDYRPEECLINMNRLRLKKFNFIIWIIFDKNETNRDSNGSQKQEFLIYLLVKKILTLSKTFSKSV